MIDPFPAREVPARAAGRLFCFGLGYCARALARLCAADGLAIAGTTRSLEAAEPLSQQGWDVYPFDGSAPLGEGALDGASHVLVSVPPEGAADPVLVHHARALAAAGDGIRWIGYLSTTGVYGDRAGGWVDEGAALKPTSERSRHRVAAELAWLRFGEEAGLAVHVFRLAGIYGPGRNALAQLRAGTARRIDKPGQVFSRIHVDDVARVLRASMARPRGGAVYNVCDDEPAAQADVIAFAASLLGMEPPPVVALEAAALSPMALSFWRDSKRVRNDRIKRELGVALAYPDYRAGLRAILETGKA